RHHAAGLGDDHREDVGRGEVPGRADGPSQPARHRLREHDLRLAQDAAGGGPGARQAGAWQPVQEGRGAPGDRAHAQGRLRDPRGERRAGDRHPHDGHHRPRERARARAGQEAGGGQAHARRLGAESGRNVVIGEDVKGKMSITLRNVPWDLALDTIMEASGLVKVERDNVLRIVSSDQLAKERESRAKLEEAKVKSETEIRTKLAEAKLKEQEAAARQLAAEQAAAEQAARGPLKEETIRLSYADPEEVARTLEGILGLQGGSAPAAPTSGPGVIPAPPFSQLFGPGQVPTGPPR